MRLLTPLLVAAALAGPAPAAAPPQPAGGGTFVYVSVAAEKRIAVYRMDRSTGKLSHRSDAKSGGEPGALVVDPGRRFLFAALRAEGKLSSFRIDPRTGALAHVNTVPAGRDPAHVSTDASGRFLFTAYYVDAKVTVHAINEDGAIGDRPQQTVATADKAHAIVPDPSGRFVFVPHTGAEAIFQFRLDAAKGRLTANEPAKRTTEKGTGPRHLVFHPSLPVAYVVNEQGGSVTAHALDPKTGTLAPQQTASTLPKDFRGSNACAEIRLHPSGKFLYASNRGHDSIAAFALGDEGKLSSLGQEATEKTPRSFDLDPSGKFLFAAGESSGKLAAYSIDGKTGRLKRSDTFEVGKTPWWVLAVDLPAPDAKPLKGLDLPGESFLVAGRPAFVLLPALKKRSRPQPWVLYAPTLPGLPDRHEEWMHRQFLEAGIAVAGIDVGEAYGSPRGRELFTALYGEMTRKRGFAPRPCLLCRSRGGLWATAWAADHPDKVAGLAGIYPVFDLRSYPGLARAAGAYGLSEKQLAERLGELNPIERVGVLAEARVRALLIHGDEDRVVPLKQNSAEFAARYKTKGASGAVELIVAKGQGHNYWEGFFRCRELVDFVVARARAGREANEKSD